MKSKFDIEIGSLLHIYPQKLWKVNKEKWLWVISYTAKHNNLALVILTKCQTINTWYKIINMPIKARQK
jgi:predicted nucleotide-binding protein (sugar kinase/HSP70/actin superfamily)